MREPLLIAQEGLPKKVVEAAKSLEGSTYSLQSNCVWFVRHAFEVAGVNLPPGIKYAKDLLGIGERIPSIKDLMEGDILLLRYHNSLLPPGFPGHCGIYLGEEKAIHNSWHYGRAVINPLQEILQHYGFFEARRLANATNSG